MRRRWLWMPALLAGFVALIFIGGSVVQLLWNWLLPPLFDWRPITFWQALGLLALSRILFGGFGMRGYGPRSRLRGRWEHMTPEERERFRDGMRARWGFGPSTTEPGGQ